MTLSLILADTVADTCWHCRWYLLTLSLTLADTCWHCRWYLLTLDDTVRASDSRSLVLILVLTDHRGRLGDTSSYSEYLGFCSRLRPAVPREVLRFYCVPTPELRSHPFRFLIYWRLLSCGMWLKYTDLWGTCCLLLYDRTRGVVCLVGYCSNGERSFGHESQIKTENMFPGHIVNHS